MAYFRNKKYFIPKKSKNCRKLQFLNFEPPPNLYFSTFSWFSFCKIITVMVSSDPKKTKLIYIDSLYLIWQKPPNSRENRGYPAKKCFFRKSTRYSKSALKMDSEKFGRILGSSHDFRFVAQCYLSCGSHVNPSLSLNYTTKDTQITLRF